MSEVKNCLFTKKSRWRAIWDAVRGKPPVVRAGSNSTITDCTFEGIVVQFPEVSLPG